MNLYKLTPLLLSEFLIICSAGMIGALMVSFLNLDGWTFSIIAVSLLIIGIILKF